MNYKDMIIGLPGYVGYWTAKSSNWKNADPETIVHAAIHKRLHYSTTAYTPENIWEDPMAQRLCGSVGTNLTGLKLRDFGVNIWIMPQPNLYEDKFREVSPSFMKETADEILADKRLSSLVHDTKKSVSNGLETVKRLRKTEIGLLVTLGGWYITQNLIYALQDFAKHPPYLLPMALGLVGASSLKAWRSMRNKRIANATSNLNYEVGKIIDKHWIAAAIEHGFNPEILHTIRSNGVVIESRLIEVNPANKSLVQTMVEQAEDWAVHSPYKTMVFEIQAQSKNPDLGSTTIGMVVSPPQETSGRPPMRKDPRKKRAQWLPDWTWLPRPAPIPT